MPRIESFALRIRTGERGLEETPSYTINGFTLPFDSTDGSTVPGGVLEASAHPQSFPHTLTLVGPSEGAWDIEGIEAEYFLDGEESYTVRLGPVTLDDHADLRLWYPRPAAVIDV
jgi:hypothetical protein